MVSGDAEMLFQAMAVDPITTAVLTLREIRELTAGMLEAERIWLPRSACRTGGGVPTISMPNGMVRRPVPLDPALAIASRSVRLAEAKYADWDRGNVPNRVEMPAAEFRLIRHLDAPGEHERQVTK